jgi:hypothetical protein
MSLRESAAAILKPGHSPNPDLIKLTNYYYDPNSRPAHSLHPTVKAIAASAFDKSLDRKSFIDQTMATLELLDTNIKNR